jgi:hypothetical protein
MKVRYVGELGFVKSVYTFKTMVFVRSAKTVIVKSNTLSILACPSVQDEIFFPDFEKDDKLTRIGFGRRLVESQVPAKLANRLCLFLSTDQDRSRSVAPRRPPGPPVLIVPSLTAAARLYSGALRPRENSSLWPTEALGVSYVWGLGKLCAAGHAPA